MFIMAKYDPLSLDWEPAAVDEDMADASTAAGSTKTFKGGGGRGKSSEVVRVWHEKDGGV